MLNWTPPRIDNEKLLKEIIKNKGKAKKIVLEGISSYVYGDYKLYATNKYALECLVPDSKVSGYKEELISCYEWGKSSSQAKKKVVKKLPEQLKEYCPYCLINEPDTLDHYLDKSKYPEYAMYTYNLIPCCSVCNKKKGTNFLKDGNRMFINYYYDELPKDEFLHIDVDIKSLNGKDLPYIKSVKLLLSKRVSSNIVIINHFTELNLIERYKKKASTKLTNIYLSCKDRKVSKKTLRNNFMGELTALEQYGVAYWETALYNGLLRNKKVIDFLTK